MDDVNEKVPKKKHTALKIILIIFIILILLAIITLAGGYFYIKNELNKIGDINLNAIKDISETMEYGDRINYETILEKFVESNELAENSTIQIEVNNEILNPSEEYVFQSIENTIVKITITCDKFSFLKQYVISQKEITLEVVDTKMPVISGVQDIEITKGDTIDLTANITAKDEVDGDLEIQIEGDFDPNTVGTYTLTVKAVDKNQNETTESFTVTVKEKPVVVPSKPTTSSSNSSSSNKNTSSSNSNASSSSSSSSSLSTSQKDAEARVIAKQIASRALAAGGSDLNKVSKAAQIVANEYISKATYTSADPDYRTAYGVFVKGVYTCAGATRALGMVLSEMGYSWTHANANQYTHQWVILNMDGQVGYADGQVGWAGYGAHPVANQ